MGNIEKLKDYLRCVGKDLYENDKIEDDFMAIAKLLLNGCIIKVKSKRYRMLEIEFYLFGRKHQDIIAYPRTDMEGGEWFFHPSGVDLCFKSHCEIKDDHFVIDIDRNKFGGILIRSIEEVDCHMNPIEKPIFGPWNSMDVLFHKFGAFDDNRDVNQISCIEEAAYPSNDCIVPIPAKRHIPVMVDGISNKVKNILSNNYKLKEGVDDWKESFETYLKKNWRYYIQRENFWKNYNANPTKAK